MNAVPFSPDPFPALGLLVRCKALPGFVAYVSIVGQRARGGRSLEALLMLQDTGAPRELAHVLVSDWPQENDSRLALYGLALLDLELLWLASAIPNVERAPWAELLQRAARRASAQVAELAEPKRGP